MSNSLTFYGKKYSYHQVGQIVIHSNLIYLSESTLFNMSEASQTSGLPFCLMECFSCLNEVSALPHLLLF